MINLIQNPPKLITLVMVLMLCFSACKSKKKAMEASAAEKARMEQQEAALRKQQEEEARKKEAEEKAKREAEARELEAKATAPKAKLTQYFEAIAGSSNVTSANSSISEALAL
ncbi:MAG: hypothetical protein ACOYXT_28895, partial [Bacteroidota bacterium]